MSNKDPRKRSKDSEFEGLGSESEGLGRPDVVPAEEFAGIAQQGEYPEWRRGEENEAGKPPAKKENSGRDPAPPEDNQHHPSGS